MEYYKRSLCYKYNIKIIQYSSLFYEYSSVFFLNINYSFRIHRIYWNNAKFEIHNIENAKRANSI